MKLAEAFARKTYEPRHLGNEQLKKAKKEFASNLKTFTLAQLQEIWHDLYDRGEMDQKYFDWVRSLIAEGNLADIIVDFLDFKSEVQDVAKSIEDDFE